MARRSLGEGGRLLGHRATEAVALQSTDGVQRLERLGAVWHRVRSVNPTKFFGELKRRNVYKVAIAYGVIAWLLTQIATQTFPFFEIPNSMVRAVIVFLLVGFPIALVIAWAFELTPEGLKRTEFADQLPEKSAPRRAWIYVVIIASAISVSLFFLGRYTAPNKQGGPAEVSIKSIAVLPFENLSEEKANAYFADGIQNEILTKLAGIGDLKVISRSSTAKYKSKPKDLKTVARELGVATVLEGSVQKAGDKVRVNVQLLDARIDTHLWAKSYDRELKDVFAVESEVAMRIAETLRATLTGAEESAIGARPTENTEAHDLYLKGRYFVGTRTSDDFKRAIDYFNQAIAKDPNYALAYAGLADSYTLLPQYSNQPAEEFFAKAKVAADKALALDENLAEAHVSRGLVLRGSDLNLKDAKREFERAIELNPNYADAHYFLGRSVLAPLGQFDQAISEVKRAIELDPFSVIMNTNLGHCYMVARRYPEAIAELLKTVELDPDYAFTRVVLGGTLELSGDLAGAIKEYERAYEIEKADKTETQNGLAFLTRAYALRGEREKALQLLGQIHGLEQRKGEILRYGHALIQLALGNKNEAINWLERSYEAKEVGAIPLIKVDPFLDPLRGDPRFEKLANQIIPLDSR